MQSDDPKSGKLNAEVPREDDRIVNKTTLSTSEKIYQDRVTAGDLVDGKLEATASNSQGGVKTTSFKTIEYIGSTDSPYLGYDNSATGEKDKYGQGNTPSDNYVEGLQGNRVRYKLYVTNDSQTELENFTVIDRLPFENVDIGLVFRFMTVTLHLR